MSTISPKKLLFGEKKDHASSWLKTHPPMTFVKVRRIFKDISTAFEDPDFKDYLSGPNTTSLCLTSEARLQALLLFFNCQTYPCFTDFILSVPLPGKPLPWKISSSLFFFIEISIWVGKIEKWLSGTQYRK